MTQVEEMYEFLKKNGSITGMDAIGLGIMNYKGRIADLRKLGVSIDTVFESTKSRNGMKKTFARYIYRGG